MGQGTPNSHFFGHESIEKIRDRQIIVSVDELIPHSCSGTNHQPIFFLIVGVVFVILLGGF